MKDGRLHVRLDTDLIKEVRVLCAERGLSITALIDIQLRQFVKACRMEREAEVEQA